MPPTDISPQHRIKKIYKSCKTIQQCRPRWNYNLHAFPHLDWLMVCPKQNFACNIQRYTYPNWIGPYFKAVKVLTHRMLTLSKLWKFQTKMTPRTAPAKKCRWWERRLIQPEDGPINFGPVLPPLRCLQDRGIVAAPKLVWMRQWADGACSAVRARSILKYINFYDSMRESRI